MDKQPPRNRWEPRAGMHVDGDWLQISSNLAVMQDGHHLRVRVGEEHAWLDLDHSAMLATVLKALLFEQRAAMKQVLEARVVPEERVEVE
jgi:hypothetical protein